MRNEIVKVSTAVELVTESCTACGVIFAIPYDLRERLFKDGTTFYCPNGHRLWFGKSEADKLRHRLDQTEAELERQRASTNGALLQLRAQKGHNTRLRKRIQNGVCPECHRHFENLERHMKTKHNK